jgi:hypothetical protein
MADEPLELPDVAPVRSWDKSPNRHPLKFPEKPLPIVKESLSSNNISHSEFWFMFEESEAVPGFGLRYFENRHRFISPRHFQEAWPAWMPDGSRLRSCRLSLWDQKSANPHRVLFVQP